MVTNNELECPSCGVDREKEPCPRMADECVMPPDAHMLARRSTSGSDGTAAAELPQTTDDARRFLVEWHRANWKHAPFFGNYISTELAGDFAYHLARWLANRAAATSGSELAPAITEITDGAARTLIDFIYDRIGFADRDVLIGEVQRIVIGCMNASYSAGTRDSAALAQQAGAPVLYARRWELDAAPTHSRHGVMTSRMKEDDWNVPLYLAAPAPAAEEVRHHALCERKGHNPLCAGCDAEEVRNAAWREGVLMAASVLVSTHDQPTIAADIIQELQLQGADCSALDDFDKVNLRKIVDSRPRLMLRGLHAAMSASQGKTEEAK